MTLQKFRLAYLLVVVLTVTTVYAIADLNQGMPLELSDSEMQELSGQLQNYVCIIAVTSTNCPTSCTHINSTVLDEVRADLRPPATSVKRRRFYGVGYDCDYTGNPSDWCNRSDFSAFCRYKMYSDEDCILFLRNRDVEYRLDCDP